MVSLLDIIGPVMVGPSSSHTAGACRLGLLARGLVEHRVLKLRISQRESEPRQQVKVGPDGRADEDEQGRDRLPVERR